MAEMKNLTINGTQFTLPFAPAGYGLGGFAQSLNSSHDLNTVTGTGFYRWGGDRPANAPFGYAVMEHIQRGNDSAYQRVTMISGDTFYQTAVHRFMSETWGEWEWVNPPMALGVEYRTTERHNGAVVYAKAINFGTLPSGAYKDVAHGIDTKSKNVRFEIIGENTNLLLQPNPNITSVIINSTIIQIATSASMGAYDAVVKLWYTK